MTLRLGVIHATGGMIPPLRRAVQRPIGTSSECFERPLRVIRVDFGMSAARLLTPQQITDAPVALTGDKTHPYPSVYCPIAVCSILATSGEGRLSLLPARPKAASSGDTRRSSTMATSAP